MPASIPDLPTAHWVRILNVPLCDATALAHLEKGRETEDNHTDVSLEPDLLLRFGSARTAALTTDAFPPWYLRLTEI